MTDPQLPPSGAVPPVPPAPQPPAPQPPVAQQPPAAPPAYAPSAPSNASHPQPTAAPAPPAYNAPAAPTWPQAPSYPAPAPSGAPAPTPTYQAAPPGAYQVPVGGYAAPSGSYQADGAAEKKSGFLGILALILGGIAAVVIPVIAGFTAFEIGRRIPTGIDTTTPDLLSVLSPARDQVLWTEITFWTGTLLGIAAIVLGILAIRRKQGRGAGIAALVVAAIGPVIYWVVVGVMLPAGTAAGFLP